MALKFGKRTLFIALFIVFATLCMALAFIFMVPSSQTASAEDDHGNHTGWTELTNTGTVKLSTSGKYYLTGALTANIEITNKATVTLCLNGYTLNASNSGQSVITVKENADFTLCDCSEKQTGKVTGTKKTSGGGGGVYVATNATFTMEKGTITGNTTTTNGGGVYVEPYGTFYMKGGTITGNTASNSSSNTEGNGGGVYVSTNATFTMSGGTIGGTITINSTEITGNTSMYGGGVYVLNKGTFNMEGGTITENKASYGGGVYVWGTLNMKSGNISSNKAENDRGGGVFVNTNGTFTMEDGIISGNTANSGGGVYVYVNGTFTMNNGTISKNKAISSSAETSVANGGGVLVYGGTFIMNFGFITNNEANKSSDDNSSDDDFAEANGGGVFISGVSSTQMGTFTMNAGNINGNTASNSSGDLTSYGGGVYVGVNGKFTLFGGGIIANTAGNGGGVCVYYGEFTMSAGPIVGNTAINNSSNTAGNGGGVYVYGGTFTMSSGKGGGRILSNTASNGGGVYVMGNSDTQGTFTMSGGTIYENSIYENRATSNGGGVCVASNGVFTIYRGATVEGNYIGKDDKNLTANDLHSSSGGSYNLSGGRVGIQTSSTLSDSTNTDTSLEKGEYTISNITVTYGESYTVKVSGTYVEVELIYAYDDYFGDELPTEAGTYEVTATIYAVLNDGSVNTSTITFTISILQKDLAEDMFSITGTYIYNGTEQKAEYTYADTDKDNAVLTADDFDVTYSYNTSAGTVTVTFTGKGNYSGEVTLTYEIEKADYDASGLSLTNKTVTYNGSAQSLEITSTLPTGVTVTYYYEGTNGTTYEKTTTAPTNAGCYTVTAIFSGDENYNSISSLTADLTIEKASYDTSSLTLEDVTVTYNGEAQAVTVSGLPDGVTVTYYYMGAYSTVYEKSTVAPTDAGIYFVTAVFSGDENYNSISKLTSTLTIEKATVIEKAVQTLNITAHVGDSLEDIELPEGWEWSDTATFTSSGEYIVYATYIADDNYEAVTTAVTVSVKGYSVSDKLGIAAIVIECATFAVCVSVLAVFFLKKKKV